MNDRPKLTKRYQVARTSAKRPRALSTKNYLLTDPRLDRPIDSVFDLMSERWLRVAHRGSHSAKAIVLQHYLVGCVQPRLKKDPAAFSHTFTVGERELARILSDSKWVANGNYKVVRSAIKQLGNVPYEIETIDPITHRVTPSDMVWVLSRASRDPVSRSWTFRFSPDYAELYNLEPEDHFGKNMLKDLRKLKSALQMKVYELACSVVGFKYPPLIPYEFVRRYVGLTGCSYRDPRRLRAELTTQFKEIEQHTGRDSQFKEIEQQMARHFEITGYDERGIRLKEVKAIGSTGPKQLHGRAAQAPLQGFDEIFDLGWYAWPHMAELGWGDGQLIVWKAPNGKGGVCTWQAFCGKKFWNKPRLKYRAAEPEEVEADRARQRAHLKQWKRQEAPKKEYAPSKKPSLRQRRMNDEERWIEIANESHHSRAERAARTSELGPVSRHHQDDMRVDHGA
jgi:hypothetical protein